MAISPDHRFGYVAQFGKWGRNAAGIGTLTDPGTLIWVLDLHSRAVIGQIDTAPHIGPHGMKFDCEGRLWVTFESNALGLIDTAALRLEQAWNLGEPQQPPRILEINDHGTKLYCSGKGDDIIVFDCASRRILSRIAIAGGVTSLTAAPDGRHLVTFDKTNHAHPKDAVARMMLTACNSLIQRFRDTTLYTLTPIQNDEFVNAFSIMEYQNGVVFTADKKVFFGRKIAAWTGNSYLDLYAMNKDVNGNWMSPELLKGDINGRFHEGPATFTADGKTVYFTRSNYLKRRMDVNAENENNLKIFQATLIDGEWKNLVEFPYNSDDYSCGHPTLSADNKTLYFISDMPGGEGGTDIYASQLEDGVWSTPINLGRTINTSGNEMFPFIHDDGALYFSSDAHNSMGGLDVFITYFNGKRWMQPENLNYPLNSPKDDFGFSLNRDNHTGFVSSSRNEADQMFAFEKHPPQFNLIGTARYKGTINPVEGVIVEITNAKTGEIETVMSDANGNFKIKLQPDMEYDLFCTKMGCFSRTDKISTLGL
jgi:hypothetical protein